MKNLLTTLVVMAVLVAPVMAWNFDVDKTAVVVGEYNWTGSSWASEYPTTAVHTIDAFTNANVGNIYVSGQQFGNDWEYRSEDNILLGGSGKINQVFNALTVNKPGIAPVASDAWTNYGFKQMTQTPVKSYSNILVSGLGDGYVETQMVADTSVFQETFTRVNMNFRDFAFGSD